ncbi:MAG: hypothetical protein KKG33_05570 [candidate division Zixibacteria bacterium]|nr:hypothetical protein [candidate division Zixibacteria bacterium]MBU1470683.1 hypothetical protein [candidate division Zixibacteria bacterium]MBU2625011.1 hypothetical protein [candidate division Zixibacteria bacterium]
MNRIKLRDRFAIAVAIGLLLSAGGATAKVGEMEDMSLDIREYRAVAGDMDNTNDKIFLSDLAIQSIMKQESLWDKAPQKDQKLNDLLAVSYANFIFLQYKLDNPSWARWGLSALETHSSDFLSTVDEVTGITFQEQLDPIKNSWLNGFAECTFYNELVPAKGLTNLQVRLVKQDQLMISEKEKYIITVAEHYLNRELRMGCQMIPFVICLPPGEYRVVDDTEKFYPKEFTAVAKVEDREGQYLYMTPPYGFNFVPIAKVYNASDSSYYLDTLSCQEFELVRYQEGPVNDFDNVEFGRYLFRVNPPFKIVDDRKKLIIPRDEFGLDYLEKHSELIPPEEYDVIVVQKNEALIYTLISGTITSKPKTGGSDRY